MNEETKGAYNNECNRTACNNPNAKWYHYLTEKYYCSGCATLINDANRTEAYELFGHNLCLLSAKPVNS